MNEQMLAAIEHAGDRSVVCGMLEGRLFLRELTVRGYKIVPMTRMDKIAAHIVDEQTEEYLK
jgi:hypothetical protein